MSPRGHKTHKGSERPVRRIHPTRLAILRSSCLPGFDAGCVSTSDDQVESLSSCSPLEPEVVDALWATIEPLPPAPEDQHPLGCHRRRVPDRLCFRGILIRLVTGASCVDIEAILDHQVSNTTLRTRRDEWIDTGLCDQLRDEAMATFDRIIGLDLSEPVYAGRPMSRGRARHHHRCSRAIAVGLSRR